MASNWTCPRCGAHTTLQSSNFKIETHDVVVSTADKNEGLRISYFAIKCPDSYKPQAMGIVVLLILIK